jgi:thiamine monophosphate kinase
VEAFRSFSVMLRSMAADGDAICVDRSIFTTASGAQYLCQLFGKMSPQTDFSATAHKICTFTARVSDGRSPEKLACKDDP